MPFYHFPATAQQFERRLQALLYDDADTASRNFINIYFIFLWLPMSTMIYAL